MATALVDLYGSGSEQFDQLVLQEGYRPSDDEAFMCVEQRAYFLQKLKAWKESIIEESRATMAQLQVDSLREPDIADEDRCLRAGHLDREPNRIRLAELRVGDVRDAL